LLGANGKALVKKSEADFINYLHENGAKKLKKSAVRREPEECYYKSQILQPEKMINPRKNFCVLSPVKLEWKPNIPQYIELYCNGDPVKKYCHKTLDNLSEIDLAPDLYELKVKHYKKSDCCDNVWFLVEQKP